MLKIDRQAKIESILQEHGSVLIHQLSDQLHCSEETIRRDLREMEAERRLVRTRGGAYLDEKYDKSYPVDLRRKYYPEIKAQLATEALHYIHNNDVICLDSSTTCLTLAEQLIQTDFDLTIITNSLPICMVCMAHTDKIRLVCLGGDFQKPTASFVGHTALQSLDRYLADFTFLSPPKLSLEFGMTDNTVDQAVIREKMLRHAKSSILLADHTKFHDDATVPFGKMSDLTAILTDTQLPVAWREYCRVNRIRLTDRIKEK